MERLIFTRWYSELNIYKNNFLKRLDDARRKMQDAFLPLWYFVWPRHDNTVMFQGYWIAKFSILKSPTSPAKLQSEVLSVGLNVMQPIGVLCCD